MSAQANAVAVLAVDTLHRCGHSPPLSAHHGRSHLATPQMEFNPPLFVIIRSYSIPKYLNTMK